MADPLFEPLEGVPDYPRLEEEVLDWWDRHQTFAALRRQTTAGEPWHFQDGPITANNPMGVHHAWGRTYKDIFNRYHAMRGRRLRWQNGFDCQGLWVEVEVEKQLGFAGKPDILAYGLDNFSRACRERVDQFAAVISQQSRRLGQWMDWDHSYYTFDDSNIEHIWGFLKHCRDEDWLAQDYRVMPWCPRCETSLSQHESADSYKDVTHRSVFIKLPIVERPGEFFLVWTTTPWTLTANTALALHPDLAYVRVRSGDDILILSQGTIQTALRPQHEQPYEVLGEIPGRELIGLHYSGPFDDLPLQQEMNAATPRRTVAWTEVGEAEGTGIVHIAPGCGAEDFQLGRQEGLGFIAPVTPDAHFVAGCGPLEGKHALADVELIFSLLEERARLYRVQRYSHSYPHCWRCNQELIFFATQEWFIRADGGPRPARERLRAAAARVEWIPAYAGKRMDDWLSNMGDWCISRKRFWGLPLPFYLDEDGSVEVIGSRAELRERAVDPSLVDALPELHRPWIDDILIRSRDGRRQLRRVAEVGDAWLDAGIVPFATLGYNGAPDIRMPELRIPDAAHWQPADFISEMNEQVRLWFFSMLFMGVALKEQAPYRQAMVYETMLDEDGERISKTKGNGVPYDEAVQRVGADPMRWTFAGNPLNRDIRFGYHPIHESARRLMTLWNVASFFIQYANLDQPSLSGGLDLAEVPRHPLDRWILARLQQAIGSATVALERREPAGLTRDVEAFVEDLSTWYVRRSRRRFWKSQNDDDKAEAYRTLHHVLLTLCRLIAPVIPFTAEHLYRRLAQPLIDVPESVHLTAWPQADARLVHGDLVREVEAVMQVVSLGHAARKAQGLKVRQPLARVLVQPASPELRPALLQWQETILEELNVKAMELLEDTGNLVSYHLKANLPRLGPRLGKQLKDVRQALENATPDEARRIGSAVQQGQPVSVTVNETLVELQAEDVLVTTQQQTGFSFAAENGWAVALDTVLTPDLLDEGIVRDLVRAIQNARKEAGLEISDRISLLLRTRDDDTLARVLEKHGDYLQQETLADELRLVDEDYPELLSVAAGSLQVDLRVERTAGTVE